MRRVDVGTGNHNNEKAMPVKAAYDKHKDSEMGMRGEERRTLLGMETKGNSKS